jgi:hypothetical protein
MPDPNIPPTNDAAQQAHTAKFKAALSHATPDGLADITANVAMLSPRAGDIVHVRLHRPLANHEMLALMDQLSAIAPDARFLVTDGVLDLNLLTSAQLAEIGLARIASRLVLPH